MSCDTHCCVLTRGELYIADWSGPCRQCGLEEIFCGHGPQRPLRKIGNVSSCVVDISSEVLGKENEFNPLDDTCARTMVRGVDMTMTINCASVSNLLLALYGINVAGETGQAVDRFLISGLSECDFFTFSKVRASAVVVKLLNPRGDLIQTLSVDTDYKVHESGIEIISAAIDVKNSMELVIEYNFDSTDFKDIEFFQRSIGYKRVFFKGTNYGDGQEKLFDANFHKVLFAPVNQFDLITRDEFLALTLRGSVEKDDGKWFKINKQETVS